VLQPSRGVRINDLCDGWIRVVDYTAGGSVGCPLLADGMASNWESSSISE